jgi:hypothetical protein
MSSSRTFLGEAVLKALVDWGLETSVPILPDPCLLAVQVIMAEVDKANAAKYQSDSKAFLDLYLNQIIPHTPIGLAYPYHW